ncbi:MAG: hypothetical protein KAT12_08615 [Gammaproteobacteria bacterium]|nr:hypothetical protein [Gammaproteobacteria bacterium]
MRTNHRLIIITLTFTTALIACSKPDWYQGARSAQTAQCMKAPLSEYKDCNQQTDMSYRDYEESRDGLDKKSKTD